MIITYQGDKAFRISQGDLSLGLNPANFRTKNDITLYSTIPAETPPDSFVITGPGEYEVKDVGIKGYYSQGRDNLVNTIYAINFEGMNLCFLGELGSDKLPEDTLEDIEEVDILFVPTGAYKLAVSLEPKVIIPMNYTEATLKQFIKEGGGESNDAQDKLVVKRKDLDGKKGEIIVLRQE